MTKIVILDAMPINPGDLSWKELLSLGDCTIYDNSAIDQVDVRIHNAEIILTNKVKLNTENLSSASQLKYIGVMATGYDCVDLNYTKQKHITVTNVPAYSTDSVAQLTFALLLNITHHVAQHVESVRTGEWSKCGYFSYWQQPLLELAGQVMGIVGYGAIGQRVAQIARALGMDILVHKRNIPKETIPGIKFVDLETLLHKSDVVSLHCPLTAATNKLIDKAKLAMMKPNAVLLNTARGKLIDEYALYEVLKDNKIMAAGLDVLSKEPPDNDHPLLRLPNCYLTPHIGWATYAARKRLIKIVVNNIKQYLSGTAINIVST